MKPQLSEEEIKNIRWTTIHYLHGTSPNVKIAAKMAFDELLMYKSQVEELQKALEEQKLRMQVGYKNGYESETIFWTRCIWDIDQALERSESK